MDINLNEQMVITISGKKDINNFCSLISKINKIVNRPGFNESNITADEKRYLTDVDNWLKENRHDT